LLGGAGLQVCKRGGDKKSGLSRCGKLPKKLHRAKRTLSAAAYGTPEDAAEKVEKADPLAIKEHTTSAKPALVGARSSPRDGKNKGLIGTTESRALIRSATEESFSACEGVLQAGAMNCF
jgi:hypothetical protein